MERTITSQNFENEVMNSKMPVLIDFWAPWCGPCRMLAPVVKEIAEDFEGKAKVCKVNIDEEPELASHFGIASIPTIMIVKDGKIDNMIVGFTPKEKIMNLLKTEEVI